VAGPLFDLQTRLSEREDSLALQYLKEWSRFASGIRKIREPIALVTAGEVL
jgi:hypothetical protein